MMMRERLGDGETYPTPDIIQQDGVYLIQNPLYEEGNTEGLNPLYEVSLINSIDGGEVISANPYISSDTEK